MQKVFFKKKYFFDFDYRIILTNNTSTANHYELNTPIFSGRYKMVKLILNRDDEFDARVLPDFIVDNMLHII